MHTLIFTVTKDLTYKLNEIELTKDDLGLLLELYGLDVIYDLPDGIFYMKCLESLSQLDAEEFYPILNDFINYTEQDKALWRQLIQTRWLRTVYSSPN